MVETGRERWPIGTFLAGLKASLRSELLTIAPEQRVSAGQTLMVQGASTDQVLVLRAQGSKSPACVKVVGCLENGAEVLFGIRVSGDLVGELAAIRDTDRSATVIACTDGAVHRLPKERFLGFLNQHPEAWRLLATMLGDRLDWANERRLDFAAYPVEQRLARVAVLLAERHGYPVEGGVDLGIELTQEEMGKLVGAARESAVKAVRHMRGAGLIRTGYRRIVVADLEGLRSYAMVSR
ncbi:cAMP-binding domain of CRP or a regulatory subunit of cAMP-dependent protein kinases [Actinomadura madurae]|uniref:cAMP-binding domain of CRP or a regulatory subunit of cAMP-dependent protein kinases n=1 Tax=Actinomadura madurae TaxID=1993 RepID=A0A1I5TJS6_9ACTN|nr:Crp/Fnr family transcriptional regulator [Actinomadura madurae]SFP83273.1 cAMP-binding domain of CRP or a regulatory subunit of cAMP-dependent protein kinases [Actinomadura madurae]